VTDTTPPPRSNDPANDGYEIRNAEEAHRDADDKAHADDETSDVSDHPNQPSSDEADADKQSTPAGIVEDLEEKADDIGASTDDEENP
jgi:hypothetical protein